MHIHIYKAIYETEQATKKAECLKIFVYTGAGTKQLRTHFYSGRPAVYFFTSEYIQLPYQTAESDVR